MPKIETPRNFADTIWAAIDENWGDAEACYKAMTALIAARDTAIRSECANRAVEYIAKHGFAHVSQNVDLFFAAIIGKEIGHAHTP